MTRVTITLQLLIMLLAAPHPCTADEPAVNATEIIRKADELMRGTSSYARVTMTIHRPKWTRTVTLDAWTRTGAEAFITVLSPRKDKGVSFLKRNREAWQYIPSIDRTIKLPPSMMLQSWMGSDFTNDDVVRADSIITDYDHTLSGSEVIDGQPVWIVDAIPREDAPVVWGRVTYKVNKSNYIPVHIEYRDEDDQTVKYSTASDIRRTEGKTLPHRFTMHDMTRKNHRTEIIYDVISFSTPVDDSVFSLRNLRRKR
jgi:outer membrane lipoprotein-sorting protein